MWNTGFFYLLTIANNTVINMDSRCFLNVLISISLNISPRVELLYLKIILPLVFLSYHHAIFCYGCINFLSHQPMYKGSLLSVSLPTVVIFHHFYINHSSMYQVISLWHVNLHFCWLTMLSIFYVFFGHLYVLF
jgi:hypothetical protein